MTARMIESGLATGGKEHAPMKDDGFMLLRSIEDQEGYISGMIHLDMDKFYAFKKKNSN
jgi:predicted lactoylglutathione lyase